MAEVKIAADSGGGSVGLAGPSSTTSNAAVQFKLPVADGSSGQVLKTDGSGNLSWLTLPTYTNGITGYDTWSLTANKNWSGTNFLDADFTRNTNFPALGSAITKSSTVFSFPTTGIWEIFFQFAAFDSVTNSYTQVWIDKSNDGGSSNWSTITNCFDMIADDGSADTYGGSACSALVDVDNVSNIKVRFGTANEQGAQFRGHSSALITGVIFKRIGDT